MLQNCDLASYKMKMMTFLKPLCFSNDEDMETKKDYNEEDVDIDNEEKKTRKPRRIWRRVADQNVETRIIIDTVLPLRFDLDNTLQIIEGFCPQCWTHRACKLRTAQCVSGLMTVLGCMACKSRFAPFGVLDMVC